MTPTDLAIDCSDVVRRFGDHTALAGVDLRVARGQVVGLIGPNGAGKTTLVRLLTGLLRAHGGHLQVLGFDPQLQGEALRQRTGVLTESAGHYKDLTGLEEMTLFARLHGVAQAEQASRQWLEAVGLGEAMHQKTGGYSTGMARRLGLARALVHGPELLLLDEPTSGLDPGGIRHVLDLLADQAKGHGTTVLLCSHVLSQLESVCDRYAVLEKGRLRATGTLAELADLAQLPNQLTLQLSGTVPQVVLGLPLEPQSPGHWTVALDRADRVPELVRALAPVCDIHSVQTAARDLERAYFALLGGPA